MEQASTDFGTRMKLRNYCFPCTQYIPFTQKILFCPFVNTRSDNGQCIYSCVWFDKILLALYDLTIHTRQFGHFPPASARSTLHSNYVVDCSLNFLTGFDFMSISRPASNLHAAMLQLLINKSFPFERKMWVEGNCCPRKRESQKTDCQSRASFH